MALAAIALGVAAIVVAGGFIHDVYIQFGEAIIHSQYGHLQVYRKGYTSHGTQRPMDYLIDDPATVAGRLAPLPVVRAVLSRLRFTGTANAGGADLPITAEGIEPSLENRLGTFIHLLDGRLLRDGDAYAVIVGAGVSKTLHATPGGRLSLNVMTREGALNSVEFDIVGVFRSESNEFDAHAVRLPLRAAQDLLGTQGVNEVVVELADTSETEDTAAYLRRMLDTEGYEVRTWSQLADFYTKTTRLFDRQFGFLQVILFLLIALSVSNTITTTAFERLPEFGTMLALGDRRGDVFRLIMLECAILGFLGSLFGLALGMALAFTISAVGLPMPPPPNTDMGYIGQIRIVASVLLSAFGVGAASAALAGLAPSLKIASTAPVDALRPAI